MLPLSKSHYYVIINKDKTFPIEEVAEDDHESTVCTVFIGTPNDVWS